MEKPLTKIELEAIRDELAYFHANYVECDEYGLVKQNV